MHILEKAFIDLLRNYISVENGKIFTGSRYVARDNTPCISVVLADESLVRSKQIEMDATEYIQRHYDAEVWINIWCTTEEERQNLIDEITQRILQAEANHHTTCTYYICESQSCNLTQERCESLTSDVGRANKNQCPNIKNYQSFFQHYHILKKSFKQNSVTNLDELDISEPILRTIFRLKMDYFTYYEIGGMSFDDLIINGEIL